MNIDEAMKEAEQQIRQCGYLRECTPGVYETGLNVVYERKSEMLQCLTSEIRRLKANQTVRCGECVHYEHSDEKGVLSHCGNHGGVLLSVNKANGLEPTDFCSYGERRDAE